MKYYLILFSLGLIIGLFIAFTYYSNTVEKQLSKWETAAPKDLQVRVKETEKVLDQKSDSFQKQNASLQTTLKATKKELETAKQKVYSLRLTLFELLDQRYENRDHNEEAIDMSCDTLAGEVLSLMQASQERDSLYEKVVTNLEAQTKNKDSLLAVKDHQYSAIKAAFKESIRGQEALIRENKLLVKKEKGQKLKSKLLSGALLVVTGAAATIFLQR